jgi:putative phage-type endonuclease
VTGHNPLNQEQAMSDDFHAERRTGLGGSDMGAVLGLNPYRTPFQVFQEKTGRAEPFTGNLQTRFGTYAEEFVAREYSERTGNKVQRFNMMLQHRRAPLIGHVDRLIVPKGRKTASYRHKIRTDRGLETKTAHALAASRGDEWGEDGTDQVPQSYLVQCATYMALTECQHWDLACLFGNSDFRVYHLARDLELEEMLLDEANRWWRNHVIADVPPDPSSEIEARQRWSRHVDGRVIEFDDDQRDLLYKYATLKGEQSALEKEIQAARDRLIPMLGDAETVGRNGIRLATFRANKDSIKTDWKAAFEDATRDVRKELVDECIGRYTTLQPGARVLRLTKEMF